MNYNEIIDSFSVELKDKFNKKTKKYTRYEKEIYVNRLHTEGEEKANEFMKYYFIEKRKFNKKYKDDCNKNTIFEGKK